MLSNTQKGIENRNRKEKIGTKMHFVACAMGHHQPTAGDNDDVDHHHG